jgi:hypothetical protein
VSLKLQRRHKRLRKGAEGEVLIIKILFIPPFSGQGAKNSF